MQYFDTSNNQSPVPWIHELFIPWIRGKRPEWQHGIELLFLANQQQAAATSIYTRFDANNNGVAAGKRDIYIFLLKCHEQLRNFRCVLHKFHILEWDLWGVLKCPRSLREHFVSENETTTSSQNAGNQFANDTESWDLSYTAAKV